MFCESRPSGSPCRAPTRCCERSFPRPLVALGESFAEIAQRSAGGTVGPVAGGALLGLTGAFQRRKMISHSGSLPSFPMKRCSGGCRIRYFTRVSCIWSTRCQVPRPPEGAGELLDSHRGDGDGRGDARAGLVRSACADLNMAVFEWSIADGLVRSGSNASRWSTKSSFERSASSRNVPTADSRPRHLQHPRSRAGSGQSGGMTLEAVFVLKDFHRHMEDPVMVRRLRDVGQKFSANRRTP